MVRITIFFMISNPNLGIYRKDQINEGKEIWANKSRSNLFFILVSACGIPVNGSINYFFGFRKVRINLTDFKA